MKNMVNHTGRIVTGRVLGVAGSIPAFLRRRQAAPQYLELPAPVKNAVACPSRASIVAGSKCRVAELLQHVTRNS